VVSPETFFRIRKLPSLPIDAPAAAVIAGSMLLLAGAMILRKSWRERTGAKPMLRFGGWSLITAGFAVFCRTLGGEVGTAYALIALSIAALLVVAAGIEVRSSKRRGARDIALEPEDRPTNWPRAIAKSLLAIVLSGIAAIGLGVAFAVAMPLEATDRIVIGGLLVPALWGGGMAWTLCDAKLVRATILLIIVSAVGYGIAFLPKVLT
jgi:hypothetical protein